MNERNLEALNELLACDMEERTSEEPGLELHSKQFRDAAQRLLREIPDLRKQLDELESASLSRGKTFE